MPFLWCGQVQSLHSLCRTPAGCNQQRCPMPGGNGYSLSFVCFVIYLDSIIPLKCCWNKKKKTLDHTIPYNYIYSYCSWTNHLRHYKIQGPHFERRRRERKILVWVVWGDNSLHDNSLLHCVGNINNWCDMLFQACSRTVVEVCLNMHLCGDGRRFMFLCLQLIYPYLKFAKPFCHA